MSDFGSLLEDIQRTYAEIAEVEATAREFPKDRFVLANLSSLKRQADQLEELWELEALSLEKEVCRYRIIPEMRSSYHLREVTQSLASFQDLFSQIYDAIENKIKSRARISADVAENTAFNIGFTYPGSLGAVEKGHLLPNLAREKRPEQIGLLTPETFKAVSNHSAKRVTDLTSHACLPPKMLRSSGMLSNEGTLLGMVIQGCALRVYTWKEGINQLVSSSVPGFKLTRFGNLLWT